MLNASILIFVLGMACQQPDDQSADQKQLDHMLQEIQSLSTSVKCTEAEGWTYVAYGSKACGGPVGYIAFHTSIDTNNFLDLVEQYTFSMKAFNEKYGAISDCSVPSKPSGVECIEGKPHFTYN